MPSDTVTASAISAIAVILYLAESILTDTCTIPECPVVNITKACVDSESCTDTSIEFTITVSNPGPVALDQCTVTDADCLGAPALTGPIGVGGSVQLNCSKTGTAGGSVSNDATVNIALALIPQVTSQAIRLPAPFLSARWLQ
jgi:hypothetical protein